jgi:hypothetical protein
MALIMDCVRAFYAKSYRSVFDKRCMIGAEGPGARKSTLDRMSVFEAGGPPYLRAARRVLGKQR